MTASNKPWKIVPLSEAQLLDVDPSDILCNGHFRICNTYKGGGGYDRFPIYAKKYFNEEGHSLQFVVQLYGCIFDCPYCYVTRTGVWGNFIEYKTISLVKEFNLTKCTVFHLMGGSPASYIEYWPDLIDVLEEKGKSKWIFHSDFMLLERPYISSILSRIARPRALYAVNIKGVTDAEFFKNTRKYKNEKLMWDNLEKLEKYTVPYYITFTNITEKNIDIFWSQFKERFGLKLFTKRHEDAYSIKLIKYQAIKHVNDFVLVHNFQI